MENRESAYNKLQTTLKELKKEYEISPSKFLERKIELVESKLKKAEKQLGVFLRPTGNYKPYNEFDQEQAGWMPK